MDTNRSDGEKMLELIASRQSDRSYSDKQVETEKIERIIEAGRLAPSACNAQPWKFIVVTDPKLTAEISVAASAKLLGMNSFVNQAPVQIIVIREKANFSSRFGATVKNKDYSLIDIGIASENICLQARAESLGSCIIGWFDEKQVRKILKIPSGKRVELIITIGYPTRELRDKKRKPLSEIVSYNKY
jgi:nitroreductase